MLYRSTHRRCRSGAPVKYLFHQLSRAETADFRRQRKRGSCVCCGY
jgi:hypothetical protein